MYLSSKLGFEGFRSKSMWPPNSPNLNPLDYTIWVHIKERACSVHNDSLDALEASVEKVWSEMSKDYMKSACKAFRGQIEAILATNGGVIEK